MKAAAQASCCMPTTKKLASFAELTPKSTMPINDTDAVPIPGGKALVGTASPVIRDDGEGPRKLKRVPPFRIGGTTVTNAQFDAFVAETGFKTEAERYGWSFVFYDQLSGKIGETDGVVALEWWRRVDGAYWRDVTGAGSDSAEELADHPVVHVSWNDARAYAAWVGGRLPTEAEWEHAARGGLGDVRFPWGDREPDDSTHFPCNIWQGHFPIQNLGLDGYLATAPAQSFEPNGYGLYNMVGNVWEWTNDPFKTRTLRKTARARRDAQKGFRLLKGGSFLCHKSYCYRYRIAARGRNSPDSTTSHQGFRVVWDH